MAIRAAYPDPAKIPAAFKEILERTEKTSIKNVKSELHRATNSLYKARNLLVSTQDARAQHQRAWCSHLQQAIQSWHKQQGLYEAQQKEYLQKMAAAKEEIQQAQATIDTLNKQVSGTEAVITPSMELPDTTTAQQEIQDLQRMH